MDLQSLIKNVYGKNTEEELKNSIASALNKLESLTKERMCKVYNGYLLNELHIRHIPSRLINTLDLGFNYEHVFTLIPINYDNYFLADLTFSQFNYESSRFKQLIDNGYQLIDDTDISYYLAVVTNHEISFPISVDDIFHLSKLIVSEEYSQKFKK